MPSINLGRAIAGGVTAGIIFFVAGGIIHGALLISDWEAWRAAMGDRVHPPPEVIQMMLWAVQSLVYGFAAMWVYVGIRPRYGRGPGTATLAGIIVWLVAYVGQGIGGFALGNLPQRIVVIATIGGLVTSIVAIIAGAAIYKED